MATTAPTILLVDDDLYIRDVYKEVLESEGFTVDIAMDGKEGLEKIISNEYNLILLDVMLPQLDGIGVLATLAENKKDHAPVILLTNLAHDPILKEASKYGAIMTLIKTDITPDQLVEHAKSVLGVAPAKSA
jgi:DNA-binding response OmpR family regulator